MTGLMTKTMAAFVVAEVSFSACGGTPRYHLTDLGVPPGFSLSRGTALNNRGQAVGSIDTAEGTTHAFLWDNGTMIDLGAFGGTEGLALDINDASDISGAFIKEGEQRAFVLRAGEFFDLGVISRSGGLGTMSNGVHAVAGLHLNDSGQIVGWLQVAERGHRSFLWDNGQPAYIGVPDDASSLYTHALNNHGQVVGSMNHRSGGASHAFLWQHGHVLDLGSLGGTLTTGTCINDRGVVAGWSFLGSKPGTAHAFIWRSNALSDLGTLGGGTSRAYGINNAGQIVGYTTRADDQYAAFLWEEGAMRDLDDLIGAGSGWRLTSAIDINDHGHILAYGRTNDQRRACLLTPAHMPSVSLRATTTKIPLPVGEPPPALAGRPFNLHSLNRLPDGRLELVLRGDAGSAYVIEASTNLVTWEYLGPAVKMDGVIKFLDTAAGSHALRFYRARSR